MIPVQLFNGSLELVPESRNTAVDFPVLVKVPSLVFPGVGESCWCFRQAAQPLLATWIGIKAVGT